MLRTCTKALLLSIGVAVVALGLTSCRSSTPGSLAKEQISTSTPKVSPSNDSTSASWLDVGNQIIQGRENQPPPPSSGSGVDTYVSSLGPYLTAPIDITGNGNYDMLAGPLTQADIANPKVAGVSLPPDVNGSFDVSIEMNESTVIQQEGSSYLDIPIVVSNFVQPYDGLTAWVQ